MNTRQECTFRSFEGPISDGNPWPEWLRGHLVPPDSSKPIRTGAWGTDSPKKAHKFAPGTRGASSASFEIHSGMVSRECNHDWIGAISNGARASLLNLIAGKWPSLAANRSQELASWAILFTMLAEQAAPGLAATPQWEQEAFKISPAPPGNWYVFAGLYNGSDLRGCVWHCAGKLLESPMRMPNHPNTQSMTFCVGRALFHTVRIPPHLVLRPEVVSKHLGLRTLWPNAGGAVAKPTGVFADGEARCIPVRFWSLIEGTEETDPSAPSPWGG